MGPKGSLGQRSTWASPSYRSLSCFPPKNHPGAERRLPRVRSGAEPNADDADLARSNSARRARRNRRRGGWDAEEPAPDNAAQMALVCLGTAGERRRHGFGGCRDKRMALVKAFGSSNASHVHCWTPRITSSGHGFSWCLSVKVLIRFASCLPEGPQVSTCQDGQPQSQVANYMWSFNQAQAPDTTGSPKCRINSSFQKAPQTRDVLVHPARFNFGT